jgi:hypothetical protein
MSLSAVKIVLLGESHTMYRFLSLYILFAGLFAYSAIKATDALPAIAIVSIICYELVGGAMRRNHLIKG